ESSFEVITRPVMVDPTPVVNPGGWGERFYFSVNLTDEDYDNVDVNLYARKYGETEWGQPKNSTSTDTAIGTILNLSWSDSYCPNIGIWEFYFESSDNRTPSLTNDTGPVNFTIESDDVYLLYEQGDDVYIWRNGSDSFSLVMRIWDNDTNDYAGSGINASFWVTTNDSLSTWDVGKYEVSNASSHITYEFTTEAPQAECDYDVGPHYWKVGVGGLNDDYCYKTINSSDFTVFLNTSMVLEMYEPYGQGIMWGTPLQVVSYIDDDCDPVENVTVQWEFSKGQNSWVRNQNPANQSQGWYNYTWTETERNVGYYNLTMLADKEYYGPNQTLKEDAFFIALAPDILDSGIDKQLGGWGE
ncbi:MAG: hypothetical protein KAT35_03380, partial [Candidatus Aenigmarchaeota archaeon]|nr:hypothetical protein [Candidatus Aenigmarchaeota archaeon]